MTILDSKRRRFAANVARAGFAVSALAFASALVNTVPGADRAGAVTAGTAQVIKPLLDLAGTPVADGGAPLDAGDSLTEFSFRLPNGAACSGDSNTENYQVHSYMVPVAVDPASLTFGLEGPLPSSIGEPYAEFRQPLYKVDSSPYVNASTAPADSSPGPGSIINIPSLSFKVYDPGTTGETFLPPGEYNIGVACWFPVPVPTTTTAPVGTTTTTPGLVFPDWVLDKYWNARITVVASSADTGPVGITWTAEEPPPTTTTTAPSTTTTTGGSTTTTAPGGSTTTAPGGTTTTSPEEVLGVGGGVGPLGGPVAALTLPRTGGSLSFAWWGALMVVFGRAAVLLGRKPEVLTDRA